MKNSSAKLNKRFIVFVLFCGILLFCSMAHPLRVGWHRLFWTFRRPPSYQLMIWGASASSGSFKKIACVNVGKTISENLLYGDKSIFLLNTELTMSALFDVAGKCHPLDCSVKFDDYYHYPVYMDSYAAEYLFEVKMSVIDDGALCPPSEGTFEP
jgi:hypothetical protein